MQVKARTPRWTIAQQTTFELRDLRTKLEQEIERMCMSAQSSSSSCAALQARLAEVIAEQDRRQAAELASRQRTAEAAEDWSKAER